MASHGIFTFCAFPSISGTCPFPPVGPPQSLVSSSRLGQGWEAQRRAELARGGESAQTPCASYGMVPLLGAEALGVHG